MESVEAFTATLRELNLLQPDQWDELTRKLAPRCRDGHQLAQQLRGLGWLTPFQSDRLLKGLGRELLLGQYILLDRLGEGGMAQVFKARHRTLKRVVALKVLRAELRSSGEAVRRFQREIRAIARLSHPNIVHAYDAEQLDSVWFLVMEFCEGIDLANLVRRTGPLPVEDACDYIRQAALGLEHIHAHGLVHRDIKPSNLIVAQASGAPSAGAVKILDLGLVSLRLAALAVSQTVLTKEWEMIGTPDFVAPEQVMNAHTVDARADLYSLGCTFYFLLTGRVPFAEGKPREKLLMHRCLEPEPVELLRREVPASVGQMIRRLMAKLPEDRYPSAGEVVARLASVLAETGD